MSSQTGVVSLSVCSLSMIAVLAIGCTDDFIDDEVSHPLGTDSALDYDDMPAHGAYGFREIGRFEGYVNPELGTFDIWMVEDPQYFESTIDPDPRFATINQGLNCSVTAASDGNENTNPLDTVQIHTEDNTVCFNATDCRVSMPPTNSQNGMVGFLDAWADSGVTGSHVTVRNFYDRPLGPVFAQIDTFTGSVLQTVHSKATGGNGWVDPPTGGGVPLSTQYGLFYYGPLAAADLANDEYTVMWTFKAGEAVAYTFTGLLVERVKEDCFDIFDNNCDGIVNNRCSLFGDGEDCEHNDDCISGYCDSNLCAQTCLDGEYGPGCAATCNEFDSDICGGELRGSCNDGFVGDGSCNCVLGIHGDSCQYSCRNGVLDGDEVAVDTGPSCSKFRVCDGFADADGVVDGRGVCSDASVFTVDGRTYAYRASTDSWVGQKTFCENMGYTLAMIADGAEWTNIWNSGVVAAPVWIGVSDFVSEETWVTTATGLTATYTNWGMVPGNDPSKNCVQVSGDSDGTWSDTNCTTFLAGLCEVAWGHGAVASDTDNDGIYDFADRCPDDPANDADGDGFCMGDGGPGPDNCPAHYNPDQWDGDGDDIGDECDLDDMYPNGVLPEDPSCSAFEDAFTEPDCSNVCGNNILEGGENCDGRGDDRCPGQNAGNVFCNDNNACTTDYLLTPPNWDDLGLVERRRTCSPRCENIPLPGMGVDGCSCTDHFDCATGYACNAPNCGLDTDGDLIIDDVDNCDYTPNFDQANWDMDNIGNVCDDDMDGDGLPTAEDPEPECVSGYTLSSGLGTCISIDDSDYFEPVMNSVNTNSGEEPQAIRYVDVDDDGDEDLIVTYDYFDSPNYYARFDIYENDGSDGLSYSSTVNLNGAEGTDCSGYPNQADCYKANPVVVRAANLDAGSYPDLVISYEEGGGYISVLLNDGAGGFPVGNQIDYLVAAGGPAVRGLAVVDMDAASGPDIAATTYDTSRVDASRLVLFENNGSGSFSIARTETAPGGLYFYGIDVGDLDGGTNTLDVAIASNDGFATYMGGSSLSAAGLLYHCEGTTSSADFENCDDDWTDGQIALGDLTMDGEPDVAMVADGSWDVDTYGGNGNGTFTDKDDWYDDSEGGFRSVSIDDYLPYVPGNEVIVAFKSLSGSPALMILVSPSPETGLGAYQLLNLWQDVYDHDVSSGGYAAVSDTSQARIGHWNLADFRVQTLPFLDGTLNGSAFADLDKNGIWDGVLGAANAEYGLGIGLFYGVGALDGGNASVGQESVQDVALLDVDLDSFPDLLLNSRQTNNFAYALNDQSGAFDTAVTVQNYPVETVDRITAADFDLDGLVDAVVSVEEGGLDLYYHSDGVGFEAPVRLAMAGGTYDVRAINVDGTNEIDLVAVARTSATLHVWKNDAVGGFDTPAATYALSGGSNPSDIAATDFDADGDLDLAVGFVGTTTVEILRNDGTGVFSNYDLLTVGSNPGGLVWGDIDGDGDEDLIVSTTASSTLTQMLSDGAANPTLTAGTPIPTFAPTTAVFLSDHDGNGHLDLFVSYSIRGSMSFLMGQTP